LPTICVFLFEPTIRAFYWRFRQLELIAFVNVHRYLHHHFLNIALHIASTSLTFFTLNNTAHRRHDPPRAAEARVGQEKRVDLGPRGLRGWELSLAFALCVALCVALCLLCVCFMFDMQLTAFLERFDRFAFAVCSCVLLCVALSICN
jgi:hypothetical protein